MQALQEVVLYEGCPYEAFVQRVPAGLKSISLRFDRNAGLESVWQHGSTLRKLAMHGLEDRRRDWSEQCPDTQQLHRLQSACQGLEELQIDLCRHGTEWPCRALGVLASFPKLKRLTLWFPLPIAADGGTGAEEPYMNFSAARMSFTYLKDHGSKIGELIIHSGAPPATPLGDVDIEAEYPKRNSTVFRCTLAEKDWDVAQGPFATSCPDVGKEENEWMEAQVGQSGTAGSGHVDFETFCERWSTTPLDRAYKRALRVAWIGPIPLEEWVADIEGDY